MPINSTPSAVRRLPGREYEEFLPFNVDDYLENRPMVIRLYEQYQTALSNAVYFEKKAMRLDSDGTKQINQLKEMNATLSSRVAALHEISKRALEVNLAIAGLSLLSNVLTAFGVNWITDTPDNQFPDNKGIIMVVVGILAQLFGLVLALRNRPSQKSGQDNEP